MDERAIFKLVSVNRCKKTQAHHQELRNRLICLSVFYPIKLHAVVPFLPYTTHHLTTPRHPIQCTFLLATACLHYPASPKLSSPGITLVWHLFMHFNFIILSVRRVPTCGELESTGIILQSREASREASWGVGTSMDAAVSPDGSCSCLHLYQCNVSQFEKKREGKFVVSFKNKQTVR